MRILVVDDEPLVAQTLGLIYGRHGFDVTTVHSAEQAMRVVADGPPDLLVCDIDMPGRDGVELMAEFGAVWPECPILVLTGFYASLSRVRACADGLQQKVNIVTKPCQPSDLLRTTRAMLGAA